MKYYGYRGRCRVYFCMRTRFHFETDTAVTDDYGYRAVYDIIEFNDATRQGHS